MSYRIKPLDVLWVRESFAEQDGKIVFKADGVEGYKWKPSIHMPRRHARIFLEVVDVRVERLMQISEHDVRAEGFDDADGFYLLFVKLNPKCGPNPLVYVISFKRIPDHSTYQKCGATRPILFSTPMVQAILRGEKTQTRRLVKGAV